MPSIDQARLARLEAQLPTNGKSAMLGGFRRPARPLWLILLVVCCVLGVSFYGDAPLLTKSMAFVCQSWLVLEIVRGVRTARRAVAPSVKERLRMERWFAVGAISLLFLGWPFPRDLGVAAVILALVGVMAFVRGGELWSARKRRAKRLLEPGARSRCRDAETRLDELEALADAIEADC